jgi:hypothetical protein
MNTYKGVPFVSKCRIIDIDADWVTVQTKDFSLVCIMKEGRTRLLGSDFFEPASATVASVDLLAETAVLQNFSYLGTKLGERMLVRVEPLEPPATNMAMDGQATLGRMVDISLSGMGVVVPHGEVTPLLKPGVAVHVQTDLPRGAIALDGIVLSAIKRLDNLRLSVRFTPEHDHKAIIFRYLIDRRTEIEADLRQEFYRLRSEARQMS